MKIVDAISIHERGTIIRHLAKRGRWKEHRKGALIELAQIGWEIQYTVTMAYHLVVTGRAPTVAVAIAEVNAAIHSRPRAELAGRAADPNRTGQAQLVRHRHSARASEGLFE